MFVVVFHPGKIPFVPDESGRGNPLKTTLFLTPDVSFPFVPLPFFCKDLNFPVKFGFRHLVFVEANTGGMVYFIGPVADSREIIQPVFIGHLDSMFVNEQDQFIIMGDGCIEKETVKQLMMPPYIDFNKNRVGTRAGMARPHAGAQHQKY
ncbi:MAG: hypothetical protein RB296_05405 [Acidobacteriota bacterium]|nr:hypothetical protein [Acidobacteriota bacterium]